MSIDDVEMVREFLTESYENLDRLDRELVALEKDPQNRDALAGVFRTIHTIKGTCGFLGFSKLEKVAHVGENLLSLLRDGKLLLTPEITTSLLAMVDAVRQILGEIQSSGLEGNADNTQLLADLTRLHAAGSNGQAAGASKPAQPVAQAPAQPVEPEREAAADPEASAAPPMTGQTPKVETAAPKVDAAPKTEAAPAAGTSSSTGPSASNETIRVGVTLLDKLMTLVGELVLARNQLMQFSNRVEDAGLQAVTQRMNLISTELQEEVMKTRMQPIGNVWSQFPRTVRDVAIGCAKEVAIEMEGKETELDKTIIEAIKDPLTHLVRNSVDHGIEMQRYALKKESPGWAA
jgi:two-component system chemotaxis sensor kinase CheA